jgi:hypothetical protein
MGQTATDQCITITTANINKYFYVFLFTSDSVLH